MNTYFRKKILFKAIPMQIKDIKGLNLSPMTENVLIIPVNPSLYVLIDVHVLPR